MEDSFFPVLRFSALWRLLFFTFFTSNVPQSNAVIFDAGDVDRDGDNGNYFEDVTRIVKRPSVNHSPGLRHR